MEINKDIMEKVRKITNNGETTMSKLAAEIGCSRGYLSNSFSMGKMSERVYNKLLKAVEKVEKRTAARKAKEQSILAGSSLKQSIA